MPISSTTRKAGPFAGTGSNTAFPFTYKVFAESDVAVLRACALGVETTLTLGTDYSIALNEDQEAAPGGVVTLPEALTVGCKLVLISDIPDTQPQDWTNQGGFYPENLNDGLDRTVALVQQMQERLGRAITLPATSDVADLAIPTPQANQLLAWSASADQLINLDPSDLVNVVAFGSTQANSFFGTGAQLSFALSASPGTQNNLRVSIDGVVQAPGVDFTWSGGTALTFTSPPPNGTFILVQYQTALLESEIPGLFVRTDASNIDPGVFKPHLNIYAPALEDLGSGGVGTGIAAADQLALNEAAALGVEVKAEREYLSSAKLNMAAGSVLVSDSGKGKITMRGASGAFDAATRAVGKEASNNLGFHLTGDKSGLMGLTIAFDTTGIAEARTAAAITVDGADECVLDTLTLSGFRELAGGIIHATRGANGFRAENITFKNNVTSYNNTAIIPSLQVSGICIDDDSGGVYSMSPRIRNITSDGGISQTDASSRVYGYQTDLVNVQSAAETFASLENLSATGIGELLDFWARGARIAGLFGRDGKGVMLKLIYGAANLDISDVFGRRNALGDILFSNAAGGSIPAPAKTVVRGIKIRGIDIRDSAKGFDYAYSLTRFPSAQGAQASISVKSEGADATLWPTDIDLEGSVVAHDGTSDSTTSCPAPLLVQNGGPGIRFSGLLTQAAGTRKDLFLQNPVDATKRPIIKHAPACFVSASPTSAQTLSTGQPIVFGTEVEDRLGAWDGTIFRPPVSSQYDIEGQVRVGSVVAGVTWGVELQKLTYPSTWTKVKRSVQFQGAAGEGYHRFGFREWMSPVTNPLDSGSLTDQYRLVLFTSGAALDVTAAGDLTWVYIRASA